MKNRNGFTLLETVIVLLIVSLIMQFLLILLSQSMRNTAKGTDLLVAIKQAHQLFFSIRKSMLECKEVITDSGGAGSGKGRFEIGPGGAFPASDSSIFSDRLSFASEMEGDSALTIATTVYRMERTADPRKSLIVQSVEANGKTSQKLFAVPRMKEFKTLLVTKKDKLTTESFVEYESRHLFVEIVLQMDDKRYSNREIRLNSFFTPSNLSNTDWGKEIKP